MSSKYKDDSDDTDGEVDFDFFDTPKSPPPKKTAPKSSNSKDKLPLTSEKSPRLRHDSSDSDTEPKYVRKIEAKLPVHKQSIEYSNDFESDSDNETGRRSPKTNGKEKESGTNSKEAWGVDNKYKTSHHKRNISSSNGCKNGSSSMNKYDRELTDDSSDFSTTDSDADSDVTDVSPLSTPKSKPEKDMYDMRELSKIGKPPRSPMHKDAVGYHKTSNRPKSSKSTSSEKEGSTLEKLLNADSDSMDLNLLMQAVMEMEQEKEKRKLQQRRVLFAPPGAKPQKKLNQTFNNDQVRTIDKENQRLMSRIMGAAKKKKDVASPMQKAKPPPKMTPSAVNRMKDQRKIEQDNIAMLRRLQGTKATQDLRREKLMTEYNTTLLAGHSIAAYHPEPKKKTMKSPYDANRSRSSASLRSDSMASFGGRNRPTSAKSTTSTVSTLGSSRPMSGKNQDARPRSGKRNVYDCRPEWESGW